MVCCGEYNNNEVANKLVQIGFECYFMIETYQPMIYFYGEISIEISPPTFWKVQELSNNKASHY